MQLRRRVRHDGYALGKMLASNICCETKIGQGGSGVLGQISGIVLHQRVERLLSFGT